MNDQRAQEVDPSSFVKMYQLIVGYRATQAIYVAAKLGIADLVEATPQTAEELAQATNAHAPALRRLLRMLASIGIFAEDTASRFSHTPLSETLRRYHQQSIRGIALMCGSEFMWKPWGELCEAVTTGQPVFNRMYGASFFEYLTAHPDDAAIFNTAMSNSSLGLAESILAAYDFSRFEQIVDVGGGHGALLHAILSAHPQVYGVLADLPTVVAEAAIVQSGAIAARCEVVGVDFFKSVPEGADGYVLKSVVHDWNDDDAVRILTNCRRAIRRDGRLLLIEPVLKPSNEPDVGRFNDLNMLVMLGGRERTEAEFHALLREAGFSVIRVVPTSMPLSIIESQPA